jgi:hypothetical protein
MDVKRRSGYGTNLASEFFVMSMLHRLGMDAHLTLGNKKAVDIVVVHAPGLAVTVDVKAVAGKDDWLVGNPSGEPISRHFVVLLTYDGNFSNPQTAPRSWILPHGEFLELIQTAKQMKYVRRSSVLKLTQRAEAWELLWAVGEKVDD